GGAGPRRWCLDSSGGFGVRIAGPAASRPLHPRAQEVLLRSDHGLVGTARFAQYTPRRWSWRGSTQYRSPDTMPFDLRRLLRRIARFPGNAIAIVLVVS